MTFGTGVLMSSNFYRPPNNKKYIRASQWPARISQIYGDYNMVLAQVGRYCIVINIYFN